VRVDPSQKLRSWSQQVGLKARVLLLHELATGVREGRTAGVSCGFRA
jgi:hypothetical protein